MGISKRVKFDDDDYQEPHWLKAWLTHEDRVWMKVWEWVTDKWYDYVVKNIRWVKKSWEYSKLLRKDFDWDSAYIYQLLLFKLKRTKKACIDEGHHYDDNNEEKSLRIAIKLCERLWKHDYMDRWHRKHDAKWGELKTWFEELDDGSGCSRMHFERPNAKTPEEKEQERKEMLAGLKLEAKIEQRDRDLLFKIMAKYMPYWWD